MQQLSFKIVLASLLMLITTQFSLAGAIHGKPFSDWQGRCEVVEKKEICFLIQGFSANGKQALMVTTINLKQHPKYPVVTFRVSGLLDATKDIQFKVDKNRPIGLKARCNDKECNIAFPLDARMLKEFKRGNRGIIGFIAKDTGKAVYYPVSLAGFTKGLKALKKS